MPSCFETETCICTGDNDGLAIKRLGWAWERGELGKWKAGHCWSSGRYANCGGDSICLNFGAQIGTVGG